MASVARTVPATKKSKLAEERAAFQRTLRERASGPSVRLGPLRACPQRLALLTVVAALEADAYGSVPDTNGMFTFLVDLRGGKLSAVALAMSHLINQGVDFARLHLVEAEEYPDYTEEEEEDDEGQEEAVEETAADAPSPETADPTGAAVAADSERAAEGAADDGQIDVMVPKELKGMVLRLLCRYADSGSDSDSESAPFCERAMKLLDANQRVDVGTVSFLDPVKMTPAQVKACRVGPCNAYLTAGPVLTLPDETYESHVARLTLVVTGNFV